MLVIELALFHDRVAVPKGDRHRLDSGRCFVLGGVGRSVVDPEVRLETVPDELGDAFASGGLILDRQTEHDERWAGHRVQIEVFAFGQVRRLDAGLQFVVDGLEALLLNGREVRILTVCDTIEIVVVELDKRWNRTGERRVSEAQQRDLIFDRAPRECRRGGRWGFGRRGRGRTRRLARLG